MRVSRDLSRFMVHGLLITSVSATNFWNPIMHPSEAIRALQKRADSCPSSNPVSCSAIDPNLPNDFCCPSDTICISLDSSSSALCCPKNDDGLCDKIQPIICDVKAQNASLGASIYTTKLDDKLPTCNDKCCPFGYDCQNDICVLNKRNAIVNNSTSTSEPVTTTIATSIVRTTVTVPPTAAGIDSTTAQPSAECNKFPPGVFLAGFFPGIIIGVLMTLAWVVFTGRHAKPGDRTNSHGPEMAHASSFKGDGSRPYISHPIPLQRYSNERSDFLSRTRSRAKSLFSVNRGNNTRTVDSVDMWNAKMPTPPADNTIPQSFLGRMNDVPVTPERRVARYSNDTAQDPSRPETVQIFTPDMFPDQNARTGTQRPPMPPASTVSPLSGTQGQRQYHPSSPSFISSLDSRRDSGVGSESVKQGKMFPGFGSPFQTPERKYGGQPTQTTLNGAGLTTLNNMTYQDISSFESPTNNVKAAAAANNSSTKQDQLQILSPARYQPESTARTVGNPQARARPPIPNTAYVARPETEIEDSSPEADDGASFAFDNPPRRKENAHPAPLPPLNTGAGSSSKNLAPGYSSASSANPAASFDAMLGPPSPAYLYDDNSRDPSKQNKHNTNATTFTAMLRHAGFPDPMNDDSSTGKKNTPAVPKLPKGYQNQYGKTNLAGGRI